MPTPSPPSLLVGRASEMEILGELLARDQGAARGIVVRGEPGIGKTALLEAARTSAVDRGMRILSTVGVESEAHLPFAGLHQLLHPVIGHAQQLSSRQREALLTAFGMTDATVPDPFLIALAALNLLEEVAAEAPLVLIVEDAHWLDRSSADVIAFVGRRLGPEPVVLLAALRDGFDSALADAGLTEVRLTRLDDTAASTLLDTEAPRLPSALRARLLDHAAGNPLALVELPLAATTSDDQVLGPAWLPLTTRLERAFTARLSGLPAVTRTLLLVAALNDGAALRETLAAAAAIVGGPVTVENLAPALSVRLVKLHGSELRFGHPLMRSAIHQSASVAQRHAAHGSLAETFVNQPDRRAWHRAAGAFAPDEAVAEGLEAAAASALRRGGVAVALAALERAADFSEEDADRGRRLVRAAELAFELGRPDAVARLLEHTQPLDLGPLQAAEVSWLRGVFDEGLEGGARRVGAEVATAEAMIDRGESDVALKLLWAAALQSWWSDPGPDMRRRIVAAADQLSGANDDPRHLAILAFAAPIERGATVMSRVDRLGAELGDDPGAARVIGTAGTAVGAFGVSAPLLAASAAGLRDQGRLGLLARALTLQAWSAAHRVDLSVAIPVAEEAERLARETMQPLIAATAQATQAMLAALRGDGARAELLATEAERVGLSTDAHALLAAVQHARGLAALGGGRSAEAFEHLQRVHTLGDPSNHFSMRCFSVADLADAAVLGDAVDAVKPVIADLERVARQTPSPLLHAGLGYARFVLAADGDADMRYDHALGATAAWPFLHARAQLARGTWLRRHRRTAESRTPLRVARDAFDALGTVPWSERARQELRASGERSRPRTPEARDRLTPQELQIAQLAANGLTNRQIGERLYLSHRTISSHLYRIFPKLAITSRSELSTALGAAA